MSQEHDRADVYALLAALLLGPDEELVAALAALPAPAPRHEDAMSRAWAGLFAAARRCGPDALAEYQALFAGTRPLHPRPCQAHYAQGAPDRPLALLRDELQGLGLARAPDAPELEDHLGALCEAMRVLIQCGHARATQQAFFARHLAGWSRRCLQDLAVAPGADFYRAVAALGLAFLEREPENDGMATTLYGIPNCDTVKKARTWLAGAGVEHHFHDFRKAGVPPDHLDRWIQAAGWEKLLNRQGTTWRKLDTGAQSQAGNAEGARALMLAQPSVIKRPVVEWPDGSVTVGFDPGAWPVRKSA